MPDFPSLAHVAVTVTDLDRSTRWYTALFGSGPVLDEDEESGTFHHTVYALAVEGLQNALVDLEIGCHSHPWPCKIILRGLGKPMPPHKLRV